MENQKSLSLIIKHRGKTYTVNDLENTPIKKSPTELKIIEARKIGMSISEMDESSLRFATDEIIVKGAAIYGCDMPQTEFFAAKLSDEIVAYLLEFGFENLTTREVLLALRMNAQGDIKNPLGENLVQVDFYGSFIHISFLAKVLNNYMVIRNNLERKFQNHIDGY